MDAEEGREARREPAPQGVHTRSHIISSDERTRRKDEQATLAEKDQPSRSSAARVAGRDRSRCASLRNQSPKRSEVLAGATYSQIQASSASDADWSVRGATPGGNNACATSSDGSHAPYRG